MLDRAECEIYDDAPMAQWAEQVVTLVGTSASPVDTAVAAPATPTAPVVPPFTRANPVPAPLSRNTLLSAPSSAKEVRQFGFDISQLVSQHGVGYCAGDSLGVYPVNSEFVVDSWLAATGFDGAETLAVDGDEMSLRQALTSRYDVCKVTPNLRQFVAEHSPGKAAGRYCCPKVVTWTAGWWTATASTSCGSSRCVWRQSSGKRCWCG